MVDWITDKIAIGNGVEARNCVLIETHGFRSVLTLDGSIGSSYVDEFALDDHATFSFIDGDGNNPCELQRAVETLIDMVRQSAPVLVHCQAGRSRSPVVVAGYLMRTRNLSVVDALARVAEKREIMLTPGIEKVALCEIQWVIEFHFPTEKVDHVDKILNIAVAPGTSFG